MFRRLTAVLGILTFFSAVGIVGRFESEYTMHGVVTSPSTIEDARGHLWGYDTDLKAGSDVIITFDNNNTDTIIYDDKVIDVKQAH
jgi:hypothetical protein